MPEFLALGNAYSTSPGSSHQPYTSLDWTGVSVDSDSSANVLVVDTILDSPGMLLGVVSYAVADPLVLTRLSTLHIRRTLDSHRLAAAEPP